jgi:hypothetical protein
MKLQLLFWKTMDSDPLLYRRAPLNYYSNSQWAVMPLELICFIASRFSPLQFLHNETTFVMHKRPDSTSLCNRREVSAPSMSIQVNTVFPLHPRVSIPPQIIQQIRKVYYRWAKLTHSNKKKRSCWIRRKLAWHSHALFARNKNSMRVLTLEQVRGCVYIYILIGKIYSTRTCSYSYICISWCRGYFT